MSRDPENGIVTNPKTLHKYLYANGDPVNLKDPTGHEAMVATAELDFWGAVKNAAAVAAIGAGVACILNETGQLLQGLAQPGPIISIQLGFCAAKVRKGCTCSAKCTCHVIGMPNHGNLGFFVFGSGTASSCPAASAIAKADAGASCPAGAHAQHCSYQCNGQ